MDSTQHRPGATARSLRHRAESLMRGAAPAGAAEQADALKLLHELQVHEVELRLQNEELERAQAETAEARDRYAVLFERHPQGCLQIQLDGIVIEANTAAARLFGVAKSRLRGRTIDRLLTDTSRQVWRALLAAAEHDGVAPAELELLGSDPPLRFVQAELVFDRATRTLIVAFQDVSARAQASALRRVAALTLENAHRARTEFVARMAHDMRRPMKSVIGFAQSLLTDREQRLDAAQRAQLERIERAGRHLLSMVEETMTINRLESGAMEIHVVPVSAKDILDECVLTVAPRATAAGIELIGPETVPAHCWIGADASRLREVLLGVLTNAIKHTRPGGEVRMACWRDDVAGTVTLALSDTGLGLSSAQQRLIDSDALEHDEDPATASAWALRITRLLVEGMGGTLGIDSAPNCGTTVRVALPSMRRLHGPDDRQSPPPVAPGDAVTTRRVLYIEENAVTRYLLELMLENVPGVSLAVAADGRSGIERARSLRPDLVIVDQNLYDMAGVEVLRALRHWPETRHCVCVAVSSDLGHRSDTQARSQGFRELWHKPLGLGFLQERLRALLG
jgi:PAS domain S-box-containing protein